MTEATDYALRHLPAHLADAGLITKLYELARSQAYSRRQAERFVSEPKLALSAQRTALATAAAHNDPVAVAEFAVRHVVGLVNLATESPLIAARSGALDRAWRLADKPDADDRSLWYLLLAWDLNARSEPDACERTLNRLLRLRPNEIAPGRYLDQENWKNTVAMALLGMLANHLSPTLRELATRLLPDFQRAEALRPPPTTRPRWTGFDSQEATIVEDGLRLALAGNIASARHVLNRIPLDGYGFRTRAYLHVVKSLLSRGRQSTAIALAAEILRPTDDIQVLALHRVRALADLATRLAVTDRQAALDLLEHVTSVVSTFDEAQHRFEGCHAVACAELAIAGTHYLRPLIARVMGSDDDVALATIAVSLCRILAASGRLEAAMTMAEDMPEPFWWKSFTNDAYAAMSRALSSKGELDRAREMADRITVPRWESTVEGVALAARADAFAGLVVAAAEAMETSRAEDAFEEIVSWGSGTEGDLERWNAAYREAFSALLLHRVDLGRRGFPALGEIMITSADAARIEDAAQSIAAGKPSDAAEALMGVVDPIWRGLALCRAARRATTDAEVMRLATLALDSAAAVNEFDPWLQLHGEIAELVTSLDDEVTSRLMTAFDRVATDLISDRTGGILAVIQTALRHGDPPRLPGLLASAADWPGATYGLCVLLAERYEYAVESIIRLVRDIGPSPVG